MSSDLIFLFPTSGLFKFLTLGILGTLAHFRHLILGI
jgi:hypothetical protein